MLLYGDRDSHPKPPSVPHQPFDLLLACMEADTCAAVIKPEAFEVAKAIVDHATDLAVEPFLATWPMLAVLTGMAASGW